MAQFVGNSSGNPTDRFHLLRLMQLLLETLPFLFFLPNMLIRLREITFEPLDTDLQLIARRLQSLLGLFERLDTPQQEYFLLPFGPDRLQRDPIERRHHQQNRHTQQMPHRQ